MAGILYNRGSMDRQSQARARCRSRLVAVILSAALWSASCGATPPEPTPDEAAMKALAATTIASIPTAAPLTPHPPTGTPIGAPSGASGVLQAPAVTQVATPAATTETPAVPPEPMQPATADYVVQSGDTLLAIAFGHQVSMAAIQLANEMGESQMVRLGETLTIPTEKMDPDEIAFWVVHVVQAGETLSGIGDFYGVSANLVARINQVADVDAIHIDQKLVVPLTTLFIAPEPTAEPPQVVAEAPTPRRAAPAEGQAAAQQAPQSAAPPAPDIVYSDIGGADAFRARLLELHNAERAAAGLPPLAMSPALQQSAQLHAQDCATRGYGSHNGSDGSTSRMRISRAGFTGRITGENWAFGRSPDRVFDMWFHQEFPSGPHRLNILSARYTEVGFGVADAGNGGFYFITNFGAP